MAKAKAKKVSYSCSNCNTLFAQWSGQCSSCNEWNTVEELKSTTTLGKIKAKSLTTQDLRLFELPTDGAEKNEPVNVRTFVGLPQIDRVLGGGLVDGSLLLFGGDPGIGKSTLLLQIAIKLSYEGKRVLYVSGEESKKQVQERLKRLNIIGLDNQRLLFVSTNNFEEVLELTVKNKIQFLICDSIQTIKKQDIEGSAGSVSQVKGLTHDLMEFCKGANVCALIIGHVTKDGQIAGPKLLEHMVDGVFYFEHSLNSGYKFLRSKKNRFGATNELAVLEMTNHGLQEVENPSESFIKERALNSQGCAIIAHMQGSQVFFTEFQALTEKCYQGYPQRTVQGVDKNRISLLLAVISRHLGISFSEIDVYCKVAAGTKLDEPSADLALLFSLVSAYKRKLISSDLLLLGEVGLAGEVRSVSHIQARLIEASQLGIKKAIIPEANVKDLKFFDKKINLVPVKNIIEVQLELSL